MRKIYTVGDTAYECVKAWCATDDGNLSEITLDSIPHDEMYSVIASIQKTEAEEALNETEEN